MSFLSPSNALPDADLYLDTWKNVYSNGSREKKQGVTRDTKAQREEQSRKQVAKVLEDTRDASDTSDQIK